jgi:hypothetical protein
MPTNPVVRAGVIGIAMQALMVLLGKFIPAIGAMPNFYAICGSVLAALSGAMAARGLPQATTGAAAMNAGAVGAGTSVVGGLLAVVSGQWPDFAAVQLLFPALSGGIAGVVGGVVTRLMTRTRA